MKIFAVGDLHLDLAPRSGVERFEDIAGQLYRIEERVVAEDPSVVVILGDVADADSGPRAFRAVRHVARFGRAVGEDRLVVAIPGNHDVIDQRGFGRLSTISVLEDAGVAVYETVHHLAVEEGLELLFLPYLSGAHAPDVYEIPGARRRMTAQEWLDAEVAHALKSIPPTARVIAFCHLDIDGAVTGSEERMLRGGKLCLPDSVERDPRVELIVGGHVHKSQRIREKILIAGSVERVDFNEAEDRKGYVVVDTGEAKIPKRRARDGESQEGRGTEAQGDG